MEFRGHVANSLANKGTTSTSNLNPQTHALNQITSLSRMVLKKRAEAFEDSMCKLDLKRTNTTHAGRRPVDLQKIITNTNVNIQKAVQKLNQI